MMVMNISRRKKKR